MSTLIDIKELKVYFQNKENSLVIVEDVNLSIREKETVALVGESGCGKSMTSLSIMRLISDANGKIDGEINFAGKDLLGLSESEMCKIRGKDIAMIFQDPMTSLNPVLTIGEQLTEVLIYHQKLRKGKAKEKAVKTLELVGFSNPWSIMQDYPHRLSGGMRQRVMIAMAMICNPRLLIADEPTTALDVTIQAQILDLMKELKDELNTSILLITHDLGVVSEMAERVNVMYAGQIVEESPVDVVFDEPLHPYTKGLIGAIPHIDGEEQTLTSIPGNVPIPSEFPDHCRFADRCPKAFSRCFKEKPSLKRIGKSRLVRCFLYEGKED